MKTEDKSWLDVAELEELVRLYMDCRLTRGEERDLVIVLGRSSLHTPLLDEARFMMGLEITMKRQARKKQIWTRVKMRWMAVAASLAVVMAIGISLLTSKGRADDAGDMEYAVYMRGHKVTDSTMARQIAEKELMEKNRFIAEMKAVEAKNLNESRQLIQDMQRIRQESMKDMNL